MIYTNDFVDDLVFDTKLFADDTFLFTVVYNEIFSGGRSTKHRSKVITDWAYLWKMQFNPDKRKQAVQVISSQKRTKLIQPFLFLNDTPVIMKEEQKHQGMVHYSTLNFYSHVREKIIQYSPAFKKLHFSKQPI